MVAPNLGLLFYRRASDRIDGPNIRAPSPPQYLVTVYLSAYYRHLISGVAGLAVNSGTVEKCPSFSFHPGVVRRILLLKIEIWGAQLPIRQPLILSVGGT